MAGPHIDTKQSTGKETVEEKASARSQEDQALKNEYQEREENRKLLETVSTNTEKSIKESIKHHKDLIHKLHETEEKLENNVIFNTAYTSSIAAARLIQQVNNQINHAAIHHHHETHRIMNQNQRRTKESIEKDEFEKISRASLSDSQVKEIKEDLNKLLKSPQDKKALNKLADKIFQMLKGNSNDSPDTETDKTENNFINIISELALNENDSLIKFYAQDKDIDKKTKNQASIFFQKALTISNLSTELANKKVYGTKKEVDSLHTEIGKELSEIESQERQDFLMTLTEIEHINSLNLERKNQETIDFIIHQGLTHLELPVPDELRAKIEIIKEYLSPEDLEKLEKFSINFVNTKIESERDLILVPSLLDSEKLAKSVHFEDTLLLIDQDSLEKIKANIKYLAATGDHSLFIENTYSDIHKLDSEQKNEVLNILKENGLDLKSLISESIGNSNPKLNKAFEKLYTTDKLSSTEKQLILDERVFKAKFDLLENSLESYTDLFSKEARLLFKDSQTIEDLQKKDIEKLNYVQKVITSNDSSLFLHNLNKWEQRLPVKTFNELLLKHKETKEQDFKDLNKTFNSSLESLTNAIKNNDQKAYHDQMNKYNQTYLEIKLSLISQTDKDLLEDLHKHQLAVFKKIERKEEIDLAKVNKESKKIIDSIDQTLEFKTNDLDLIREQIQEDSLTDRQKAELLHNLINEHKEIQIELQSLDSDKKLKAQKKLIEIKNAKLEILIDSLTESDEYKTSKEAIELIKTEYLETKVRSEVEELSRALGPEEASYFDDQTNISDNWVKLASDQFPNQDIEKIDEFEFEKRKTEFIVNRQKDIASYKAFNKVNPLNKEASQEKIKSLLTESKVLDDILKQQFIDESEKKNDVSGYLIQQSRHEKFYDYEVARHSIKKVLELKALKNNLNKEIVEEKIQDHIDFLSNFEDNLYIKELLNKQSNSPLSSKNTEYNENLDKQDLIEDLLKRGKYHNLSILLENKEINEEDLEEILTKKPELNLQTQKIIDFEKRKEAQEKTIARIEKFVRENPANQISLNESKDPVLDLIRTNNVGSLITYLENKNISNQMLEKHSKEHPIVLDIIKLVDFETEKRVLKYSKLNNQIRTIAYIQLHTDKNSAYAKALTQDILTEPQVSKEEISKLINNQYTILATSFYNQHKIEQKANLKITTSAFGLPTERIFKTITKNKDADKYVDQVINLAIIDYEILNIQNTISDLELKLTENNDSIQIKNELIERKSKLIVENQRKHNLTLQINAFEKDEEKTIYAKYRLKQKVESIQAFNNQNDENKLSDLEYAVINNAELNSKIDSIPTDTYFDQELEIDFKTLELNNKAFNNFLLPLKNSFQSIGKDNLDPNTLIENIEAINLVLENNRGVDGFDEQLYRKYAFALLESKYGCTIKEAIIRATHNLDKEEKYYARKTIGALIDNNLAKAKAFELLFIRDTSLKQGEARDLKEIFQTIQDQGLETEFKDILIKELGTENYKQEYTKDFKGLDNTNKYSGNSLKAVREEYYLHKYEKVSKHVDELFDNLEKAAEFNKTNKDLTLTKPRLISSNITITEIKQNISNLSEVTKLVNDYIYTPGVKVPDSYQITVDLVNGEQVKEFKISKEDKIKIELGLIPNPIAIIELNDSLKSEYPNLTIPTDSKQFLQYALNQNKNGDLIINNTQGLDLTSIHYKSKNSITNYYLSQRFVNEKDEFSGLTKNLEGSKIDGRHLTTDQQTTVINFLQQDLDQKEKYYKQEYESGLQEDIKDTFSSSKKEEIALKVLKTGNYTDGDKIYLALKGIGTRESLLNEVILDYQNLSERKIFEIVKDYSQYNDLKIDFTFSDFKSNPLHYKDQFNKALNNLIQDIDSDTSIVSGSFFNEMQNVLVNYRENIKDLRTFSKNANKYAKSGFDYFGSTNKMDNSLQRLENFLKELSISPDIIIEFDSLGSEERLKLESLLNTNLSSLTDFNQRTDNLNQVSLGFVEIGGSILLIPATGGLASLAIYKNIFSGAKLVKTATSLVSKSSKLQNITSSASTYKNLKIANSIIKAPTAKASINFAAANFTMRSGLDLTSRDGINLKHNLIMAGVEGLTLGVFSTGFRNITTRAIEPYLARTEYINKALKLGAHKGAKTAGQIGPDGANAVGIAKTAAKVTDDVSKELIKRNLITQGAKMSAHELRDILVKAGAKKADDILHSSYKTIDEAIVSAAKANLKGRWLINAPILTAESMADALGSAYVAGEVHSLIAPDQDYKIFGHNFSKDNNYLFAGGLGLAIGVAMATKGKLSMRQLSEKQIKKLTAIAKQGEKASARVRISITDGFLGRKFDGATANNLLKIDGLNKATAIQFASPGRINQFKINFLLNSKSKHSKNLVQVGEKLKASGADLEKIDFAAFKRPENISEKELNSFISASIHYAQKGMTNPNAIIKGLKKEPLTNSLVNDMMGTPNNAYIIGTKEDIAVPINKNATGPKGSKQEVGVSSHKLEVTTNAKDNNQGKLEPVNSNQDTASPYYQSPEKLDLSNPKEPKLEARLDDQNLSKPLVDKKPAKAKDAKPERSEQRKELANDPKLNPGTRNEASNLTPTKVSELKMKAKRAAVIALIATSGFAQKASVKTMADTPAAASPGAKVTSYAPLQKSIDKSEFVKVVAAKKAEIKPQGAKAQTADIKKADDTSKVSKGKDSIEVSKKGESAKTSKKGESLEASKEGSPSSKSENQNVNPTTAKAKAPVKNEQSATAVKRAENNISISKASTRVKPRLKDTPIMPEKPLSSNGIGSGKLTINESNLKSNSYNQEFKDNKLEFSKVQSNKHSQWIEVNYVARELIKIFDSKGQLIGFKVVDRVA